MKLRTFQLILSSFIVATIASAIEAQTPRALDRRVDRNERQLHRQAHRGDYYTPQTWQQIDPWIQRNGITPLARAADAVGNAANAVGNTVGRAADAADGRVDGRFGFRDNSQPNAWFYDYYSYAPTYYYGQANNDRYAGAIRYFDADNDGIFESHSYYRDSDNDGIYDEYDRLDFHAQQLDKSKASIDNEAGFYVGPEDARRHNVQGEIALIKTARVNGNDHLVVGLKQQSAASLAVDLGAADKLQGKQIEVGKTIVATGAMEKIGDKTLLLADSIRVGSGPTIQIDRTTGLRVEGTIVDVNNTKIGSVDHYMAIMDVNGERQLIDLGPTTFYKVKLQPNTRIIVQGVPVQSHNHRVIMAGRVWLGDELVSINRTNTFSF